MKTDKPRYRLLVASLWPSKANDSAGRLEARCLMQPSEIRENRGTVKIASSPVQATPGRVAWGFGRPTGPRQALSFAPRPAMAGEAWTLGDRPGPRQALSFAPRLAMAGEAWTFFESTKTRPGLFLNQPTAGSATLLASA